MRAAERLSHFLSSPWKEEEGKGSRGHFIFFSISFHNLRTDDLCVVRRKGNEENVHEGNILSGGSLERYKPPPRDLRMFSHPTGILMLVPQIKKGKSGTNLMRIT